jgi:hypothetical protein
VYIHDLHVAVDETDLGPGDEDRDLTAELVERPRVVAVEDRDELALRLPERTIHGTDEAAVLLVDDPYTRVVAEAVVQNSSCVVGRAVVDDDDVEELRRVILRKRAVEGLADEALVVMRGDDAGHRREGTGHRPCDRTHAARVEAAYRLKRPQATADHEGMIDLVVYSKDRPAQLDMLLSSIEIHFVEWREVNLSVVHVATDEHAALGYARVRDLHRDVRFVDEATERGSFKDITLSLVGRNSRVGFLMDDQVFKESFTVACRQIALLDADPDVMCVSLRMDPRMDYCYPLDRHVPVPEFEDGGVWRWQEADGDWAYPMSLDAHIFRTDDLLPLLRDVPFQNPNTLEAALADRPLPRSKLVCLPVAPTLNIPDNRVQEVCDNRHGTGDAAELTKRFLRGDRLDPRALIGLRTPSPHHEIELVWTGDDRTSIAAPPERRSMPRVSVVVTCFQYGRYLAEAVHSALDQDGVHVDVTIVDDGSTDSTADVARALVGAHPGRVRVLTQANSGHPAHARNAGIRAAEGDLVLALDADDRLAPGFLSACAAALDHNSAAGFAYGDFDEFGDRMIRQTTPAFDPIVLPTRNLLGSATLFRRSAWEAAGGYDAAVGYEDWDFWIGCMDAGWSGVKVSGALWEHRAHDRGQWAVDRARDAQIKARIALKRPHLYSAGQLAWARAVVEGQEVPSGPEGIVPELATLSSSTAPREPTSAQEPVRGFVTVARADEVTQRPDLLRAYGNHFAAGDDATLVLVAPDGNAEAAGARLVPILEALGLNGQDSPDMIAVGIVPRLGCEAAAVLTEHATLPGLTDLRHFGAATVGALRAVAEATWVGRAAVD